MRENQRLIEKAAIERGPEVDRKRCWWKRTGWWISYHLRQVWTEWSSCWAIPFFLGIRSCFFSFFLSKQGQSHFYVFVCCLSTLSLHWAVPQISFVFCFLSSCGLCLCSWLLQLPLLVFFCQRDIQSVCFFSLSDSFLPLFTVSLKTEVSFGISSISITD